ncbi:MAG: NUDIX domain-containing protein [Erysipelotrichaceae bacterium]|nr:NUDIX domain-containing protein [Erysipelotrichaceae bacterium]MDD3924900.1 NUDIX domain-containing protein [Erysipelotrichaceae bacterium]MDD4642879.1 NUDIX domain-containing protein [Erysipelotrichaceae bacterium]
MIEVYDKNGLSKGYHKERDELNADEYVLSVHIYVYDQDHNFIIQQRALTKKELPGVWCITGGAVEINENSIDAAIREVQEELSINLNKEEIRFLGRCLNNNYIVDIFSAKAAFKLSELIIKEDEVKAVKLMPLDLTLEYINSLKINQKDYKKIINTQLVNSLL